ncbi:50S ribosomal protein L18 [Desulfurella sp.]|uniref:50S ribosomal protein L18 n=1 Tax=Desulfurella sp. TaxID=1962857 RepID=UPI0025BB8B36|nr:50S ribosomal protein L18 [Desulfurella sp.]
MLKKHSRNKLRLKRKTRIKYKIRGTQQKPRLCVFKSLNHIYAQLIDDANGNTIISASSLDNQLKGKVKGCNIETAKQVGILIAKKALEKGISNVVFDRNGYLYHGKVKALADAAREGGLIF